MKDRSDDPAHYERTLLTRSYISLPKKKVPDLQGNPVCVWCKHVELYVRRLPYLYEVSQKGTAEVLLENLPVQMVVVAAGDKRGEQHVGEAWVAEVLERQGTQLL